MGELIHAIPQGTFDERATAWKRRLGQRIRLARQHASRIERTCISQDVLARRLRMFPARVWEIEQGLLAVDAVEVARIGRALNIHPGWFYDQGNWEEWTPTASRQSVTWILARSIGELDANCRVVIEQLVAALSARQRV